MPETFSKEAEDALFARIATGDRDAVGELMAAHAAIIRSRSLYYSQRVRGEAEEVEAEAVLIAVQLARDFRPGRARFGTVLTSLLNRSLPTIARACINRTCDLIDRPIPDQADLPINPEVARERAAELLDRLTPTERELVRLRFGIDRPELTAGQAARALGLSRRRCSQLMQSAMSKFHGETLPEPLRRAA